MTKLFTRSRGSTGLYLGVDFTGTVRLGDVLPADVYEVAVGTDAPDTITVTDGVAVSIVITPGDPPSLGGTVTEDETFAAILSRADRGTATVTGGGTVAITLELLSTGIDPVAVGDTITGLRATYTAPGAPTVAGDPVPLDIAVQAIASDPVNIGAPSIEGVARVGETLTLNGGVWQDASTIVRTLQRSLPTGDTWTTVATVGSSYAIPASLEGYNLRLRSVPDGREDLAAVSDPVGPVAAVAVQLAIAENDAGTFDFSFEGTVDINVRSPLKYAGTYGVDSADVANGMLALAPPVIIHDGTPAAGETLSSVEGLVLHDPAHGIPVRTRQWRLNRDIVAGETAASYTAPPAGDYIAEDVWTNALGVIVVPGLPVTVMPGGVIEAVDFARDPLSIGTVPFVRDGAVTTITLDRTTDVRARWQGRNYLVKAGRTFRFRARVVMQEAGTVTMVGVSSDQNINSGQIFLSHIFPAGGGTHDFDSGVVTASTDFINNEWGFKITGAIGDVVTLSQLLAERLT